MITKFFLRILIAGAILLITTFVLTLLKWQHTGEVFIIGCMIIGIATILFKSIE